MENSEIEQFLCDVREHFKASLETSEYENSSNLFHVTEAEATAKLLVRCELLLQQYNKTKKIQQQQNISLQNNNNDENKSTQIIVNRINAMEKLNGHETDYTNEVEASYLDMTGNYSKKKSASHEYMDFHNSTDSEKTFRCSTSLADVCDGKNFSYAHQTLKNDDDAEIYDTCVVSQYSLNALETNSSYDDCPFMNLPAGHLAINKSTKYGQLQRIEKRLFFDQCKKCFCGVLNDWLLCYADPTASNPTTTLYLKAPGIEIEHAGEGKRRDICFQITTDDPNKKFVFQANNEVDAKEWIHAIEAVKSDLKQNRRLPTPPTMKKITFVGHGNGINTKKATSASSLDRNDCIYEEPSPVYEDHTPNQQLIENSPVDSNNSAVRFYEYDIPKLPAKPIEKHPATQDHQKEKQLTNDILIPNTSETETSVLLHINKEDDETSPTNSQKIRQSLAELADKIDFQTKVKDLHSKLSSQLLSPTSPYQDRVLKKTVRKTYSDSSNDSAESMALTTSPTAKDQKKQKTASTPQTTPQKTNNNVITNNNNNNNNSNSNNCNTNNGNQQNNNNVNNEKSPKNWFLTRFQKTTSSMRNSTVNPTTPNFTKCRLSEKENLLNSLEPGEQNERSISPSSPILKNSNDTADTNCGNKSKVNMIINQLEASGGHLAMFSMEAMANLSSTFYDNHDCNYEPIMAVSSPPSSFLKKV